MPKELFRLLICQIIGWLALFSTTLFFTDFVAQVVIFFKKTMFFKYLMLFFFQSVYKGDPLGALNSTELANYNDGAKMGSICLLVYSMSTSLSAGKLMIINKNYSIF